MKNESKAMLISEIESIANADGSCADLSVAAFEYLFDGAVCEMPYGTQKARDGDPYEWIDENIMPDYVSSCSTST